MIGRVQHLANTKEMIKHDALKKMAAAGGTPLNNRWISCVRVQWVVRGRCNNAVCWLGDRILAIVLRRSGIPYTTPQQHASGRAPNTALMRRFRTSLIAALGVILLPGCAGFLPGIGPSRSAIEKNKPQPNAAAIQIIDIDDAVTHQLLAQRELRLFSETLGNKRIASRTVGPGDMLEVTIWEAAPATLFGTAPVTTNTSTSMVIPTSHATTLPDQPVDDEGLILVPFAGRIPAAGQTLTSIEGEIVSRLKGKANQPEVMVRMTRNLSSNATVVGEVNASTRVPLVPGNERLLDALAAAAGVRQPVNKMTIQVTRADSVYSLPLETIIRDPRQNVPLQPGDVVTALFQPYSFTALGATGKNEEVNFETQGITLAQALARSGGLIDARSNARGVFVFRFEPKAALDWPHQPVMTTAEGMVPVAFRIDLSDPASFFAIQSFPIENRDILYVSNAPITEVQKFLNVLFTVAYPILAAKQVGF
jgi:polysaccharide export outer membrane protein